MKELPEVSPQGRWASRAGKAASQQRQEEVVALEIIISTEIQMNPSAVEPRAAGTIPGVLESNSSHNTGTP